MSSVFDVPEKFRRRPFARAEALEAGISARVLEGAQFVRLHDAVYRHRSHEMTFADRVAAARIALPDAARTTGITRLQELGLDYGSRLPLHFVVAADHHVRISGVFLHRTVAMPAADELGVSAEAAFVAYCVDARAVDAIKVGSMLLHLGRMSGAALAALVSAQPWRNGCTEARWVSEHLDRRCRSLPEAELLTLIRFSGLPNPDVNPELRAPDGRIVIPDLWYAALRQAVEYEGSHHQQERQQYVADIDRYLVFRTMQISYLQITKERLRTPRLAVTSVHRALVQAGYSGPGPDFGECWTTLFRRLSDVARSRARATAVREPHSAA
ncbi:hypothetical protein [Nocardioides sp.]|uniref:hypothetical protein n=1 Tax=Nocardioides sp. TaxID=35761 RepID=UPI002B91CBC1|nr:hypothetical protein [Nocardioides sp.]HXH77074.1 hypothetical protein [Nocardioides sp.]